MPAAIPLARQLTPGRCLLVPGVYDCLSAKLAAEAGFRAVSISGYSVEASLLGLPDLGFAGLTDVEGVAHRIVESVEVPVICDADTGYGGVNNVWQTVRRLEKAGVAAIHIEDQAEPKKCGGMPGRKVITPDAMEAKVRAAVAARRSSDTMIIARTDAKASEGVDAAAVRLNRYLAAGADMAFAAEDYSRAELQRLGTLVEGPLAICAGVPGWGCSWETSEGYGAMGIDLAIYPFSSLFVAARAMRETYAAMARAQGMTQAIADRSHCGFGEFGDLVGVPEWSRRSESFEKG